MNIVFGSVTNQGNRKVNEDFIGGYDVPGGKVFILADGLGGMGMGDLAAKTAVETAASTISFELGESIMDQKEIGTLSINDAFCSAHEAIKLFQHTNDNTKSMTTLAILLLTNGLIQWGHIGDSRIYHFVNGIVEEQSRDHSLVQTLVEQGKIEKTEIREHKYRNRLLRAVGDYSETCDPEISDPIEASSSDVFLICSDGFWELIEEPKMEELLNNSKTPQEWIDKMEEVILRNGMGRRMDNYSAIGIWVFDY